MLNPFTWIREMARSAVVNGVTDGLNDVSDYDGKPSLSLTELQARLQLATATDRDDLPALPEATAAPKRKTKA